MTTADSSKSSNRHHRSQPSVQPKSTTDIADDLVVRLSFDLAEGVV